MTRRRWHELLAGLAALTLLCSVGAVALSAQAGATTNYLSMFAGTIGQRSCPTSGTASAVDLGGPFHMTTDRQGDVYFADLGCSALYKITPAGALSVVAGRPGNTSYSAPSLPALATSVSLGEPDGVAVNSAGDVFLSDGDPEAVYEILPNGMMSDLITSGVGPGDITLDGSDGFYIADPNGNRIEKYSGGTVSTFFSSGLSYPNAVATDSAGNVYVADTNNNRVVEVSPAGTLVKVIAGTGSATTPASTLSRPYGVAVSPAGDVFIANRNGGRVDEVTPSGSFTVIAGDGIGTPSTSVPATDSALYGPIGLSLDPSGNLYIADTNFSSGAVIEEIRGIASPAPTPGTPTVTNGSIVFPWSAVTGASSYTVTVYVNGLAQRTVAGLTGLSYTVTDPTAGASYSFTVSTVIGGVAGPASARSNTVTAPAASSGYWLVGGDGGVFSYGTHFYGSTGNLTLNQPVFAITSTKDGKGYWFVARDGGVFSYGDAAYHGSVPSLGVNVTDIVGMATDEATGGYWLVGRDGGVYAFDAPFHGSVPALGDHVSDIVGITATADGGGYDLVTSTGAVYSFGDASYHGGANTMAHRNAPIVGIALDAATGGYWEAGSDGGVYAYDAPFDGSAGGLHLTEPVVGISATTSGSGYWLVGADGGVFAEHAPYLGSMGGKHLNSPVVGITAAG